MSDRAERIDELLAANNSYRDRALDAEGKFAAAEKRIRGIEGALSNNIKELVEARARIKELEASSVRYEVGEVSVTYTGDAAEAELIARDIARNIKLGANPPTDGAGTCASRATAFR